MNKCTKRPKKKKYIIVRDSPEHGREYFDGTTLTRLRSKAYEFDNLYVAWQLCYRWNDISEECYGTYTPIDK